MRRAALLLLAALAAAGCSFTRERIGDPSYLREKAQLVRGTTTAAEVATALGPPVEVREFGDELWFVYRSREVVEKAYGLRYVFDIARSTQVTGSEDTLLLIFDRADVLRASAAARNEL